MLNQLLSLLVIVTVIVVPILPAALIFHALPKEHLGSANGQAKYLGITVNAAGGTAVYFIILGCVLFTSLRDLIPQPLHSDSGYWAITGTVIALEDGKHSDLPNDLKVQVLKPYPAEIDTNDRSFLIRVPSHKQQDWPHISVTYPDGKGGRNIDFSRIPSSQFKIDYQKRIIEYVLSLPPQNKHVYEEKLHKTKSDKPYPGV
jgi:hypothetical protein